MKINVSAKNKFMLYPTGPGYEWNDDLAEKDKFCVVLKKINRTLTAGKYTKFDGDGKIEVDMGDKIRCHLVDLINPPTLSVDGGSEEVKLTVDVLLADVYTELDPLLIQIVGKINTLDEKSEIDEKK